MILKGQTRWHETWPLYNVVSCDPRDGYLKLSLDDDGRSQVGFSFFFPLVTIFQIHCNDFDFSLNFILNFFG